MDFDSRLVAIEKDVAELKATQPFIQEMVAQNNKINAQLTHTLNEVEKSMVSMNDKMDAQTQAISALKEDVENNHAQVNERISNVKKQIENIDDEGKFNIRTFLRTYLPWIMVVLGAGFFILSKFIKF